MSAEEFAGVTHRPGLDGLFGAAALCGADPSANVGGVLRLHDYAYDCQVCAAMGAPEQIRVAHPCEGESYENHDQTFAAAIEAGADSWQEFNCHLGHAHWRMNR